MGLLSDNQLLIGDAAFVFRRTDIYRKQKEVLYVISGKDVDTADLSVDRWLRDGRGLAIHGLLAANAGSAADK
jgi:hypothetical protein